MPPVNGVTTPLASSRKREPGLIKLDMIELAECLRDEFKRVEDALTAAQKHDLNGSICLIRVAIDTLEYQFEKLDADDANREYGQQLTVDRMELAEDFDDDMDINQFLVANVPDAKGGAA